MKKLIVVLLFVFGCNAEKIVEPIPEGISGVYKSVLYEKEVLEQFKIEQTYKMQLELIQHDTDLVGKLSVDGINYSVSGTIIDNHLSLLFEKGIFDLWLDVKGNYYPLAGSCLFNGYARAIRFEKVSNLHNQGGIGEL